MAKIKVLVNGAVGKMGQEVIRAIKDAPETVLIGACDLKQVGQDIGTIVGIGEIGILVQKDLAKSIKETKADVVVDFTHPEVVKANIKIILENKACAVVGTTGLSKADLGPIQRLCDKNKTSALIAPNFAIGAVLMMKFAREASHYMPQVEIIELHHDKKADAPSGTSLKTAELILEDRGRIKTSAKGQIEKVKGVRGGNYGGIHIHSIRLKGFVAHQEVIFGGLGQILTLRHDSMNRESFMPGVVMAVKKIKKAKGLVYGLENLM